MKLETIYNDLIDIIKNDMDFTKALKLKEKLEQEIRNQTAYKNTSRTRVNAIKRVASKSDTRPALTGYSNQEGYQIVTDSYHLIAIHQENMPLKLVTTNNEEADKIGHENVIYGNYPDMKHILNDYTTSSYQPLNIKLNYDDILSFYKLHHKDTDNNLYSIDNRLYNINYLKNIIDVIGIDNTIYYRPNTDNAPLYIVNKNNEIGLILPVKKY